MLLFTASLPAVVEHFGIGFFRENGPVEWLQFGFLAATAAVFAAGVFGLPRFRALFVLLACVAVVAAFRELDKLLDEVVPWLGWKIGFVFLLYALITAYVNAPALRSQIGEFFALRAFAMLWAAFLIAVPIAQLVGHGPFLRLAMGDDYVWGYKQMIEEILEVIGYVLLLIAGIESVMQLRSGQAAARAMEAVAERAPSRLPAVTTPFPVARESPTSLRPAESAWIHRLSKPAPSPPPPDGPAPP